MPPIIGSILMGGTSAILTMTRPVQSVIRLGSNIVSTAVDTVDDTLTTVSTVIALGNTAVQTAAKSSELSTRTKASIKLTKLKAQKRETLVKYGETIDALKDRYEKLSDTAKEAVTNQDTKFPEGL